MEDKEIWKMIESHQRIIRKQELVIYNLEDELKRKNDIIELLREKLELYEEYGFRDEKGIHPNQISLKGV